MSRLTTILLVLAYVACAAYAIVTFDRAETLERAVTWTGGVLFAVLGYALLDWLRARRLRSP